MKKNITFVTGLWNINRGNLKDGWNRSFDHYLNKFSELLRVDINLIIFGDKEIESYISEKRDISNTQFIYRDISWFKSEFYDDIQKIRNDQNWLNLSSWLKDSTQASLEYYNPLVMSKMFLLHDAKILDKFNSDYLFWIDAGLTNTVHPGYFTHDKVYLKLSDYINKFSFICFPYQPENEIHGFEISEMNKIAGNKVDKVARGGFFGGPKESIPQMNNIYYELLKSTLKDGFMGTEESIFTLMCYKHPELIDYFLIEPSGLINKFFEDLKNNDLTVRNEYRGIPKKVSLDSKNVGLYVMTFNSPKQFETLIKSIINYDEDFMSYTTKFLLNNSTDENTLEEYEFLCNKYGFEHIKRDNLGICGGRQFIAEHFEDTDLDYYLFFEDDMFFYDKKIESCKNGFIRYSENFYKKVLTIINEENFDFLKLNFTEFFGDNSVQWSWYNVPQHVRTEFWPENPNLPKQGLDPNAPKTLYKNIKSKNGIPYATGEIYYCNWPQIISRNGNKKMFLDTKWAHPFEQTWMSHMYQLTKKGDLNPGILLMTPTEHNRFDHYDGKIRKES